VFVDAPRSYGPVPAIGQQTDIVIAEFAAKGGNS
jgi:hypothetical protein